MDYYITVDYHERNHSITESWEVKGEKALKRTLGEALDLQLGKDRIPTEPDLSRLKDSLGNYIGEKDIENEFRRLKKSWKVYLDLLEGIETTDTVNEAVYRKIDSRTGVQILVKP